MIFLDDAVLVATMSLCQNGYGYWDKCQRASTLWPVPFSTGILIGLSKRVIF